MTEELSIENLPAEFLEAGKKNFKKLEELEDNSEWIAEHHGEYVAIGGGEVVGTYEDEDEL